MSTWHVDTELARRYGDGDADVVLAASIEAHVLACAACRDLLGRATPPDRLAAIWDGITGELDAPRPRLIERLLMRLGVREDTARLIVTTPSLRLSWLTSNVLVLALAVLAAAHGSRGMLAFLTLAPTMPLAGVALAFSASADGTRAITAVAPYSHIRLLLIRSLAVLVSSIAVALTSGVLLIGQAWLAAAWLLPALALVTTTLALSARLDPAHAAFAVGLGWVLLVWGGAPMRSSLLAPFGRTAQLAYLLVTLLAVAAIVLTRNSFDYRRRSL
jgi:hypothetical protein